MKRIYHILLLTSLSLLCNNFNAQNLKPDSLKKAYIPSDIRIQFAGNIGMYSLGTSWSFFKQKASLEYSIGFVPKIDAERPIYISAIKFIYTPLVKFKVGKAVIKPFSAGLAFSYTFGDRFNKYGDTNRYPKGYYWWNTSLRVGLLYRAEISTKINHKHIKSLGFYFEASIWDLGIYSYFDNSNSSYISLWDITIFGIGSKLSF